MRNVTIFYRNTLHFTLNFDLQIFGFRKGGQKKEVQYLKMGIFLAAAPIATLAPPMLALREQRAPGSAWGYGVALAPPPSQVSGAAAAASTYPPIPGREWEHRLHARGGGAGSTMVPSAAPQFLARLLAARSSSGKLSGSAVDKKPGRPSASLPGAGWGKLKGLR